MLDPQMKPLTFTTEVQSLVVFFAEDTTGSMGGSISQLNRNFQSPMIPGVKMTAANVTLGSQTSHPIKTRAWAGPASAMARCLSWCSSPTLPPIPKMKTASAR
jgi:hypothetical protein